jgi:hypothetical protein
MEVVSDEGVVAVVEEVKDIWVVDNPIVFVHEANIGIINNPKINIPENSFFNIGPPLFGQHITG